MSRLGPDIIGMALDLTSVHAKLGRADEHLRMLESEIRAWIDTSPYKVIQKVNADFTHYSLVAKLTEDCPISNNGR